MSRTRQVVVDTGSAALGAGEALVFRVSPSAGNPIFWFGCEDRPLFSVSGHPLPQYVWFLGNAPPTPGEPHYPLDRPIGIQDVYGVQFSFAQCPSYRFQIMKMPIKALLLDISYSSDVPSDHFMEPFTVTAL